MEGATSELEIDSELVMSFYDQYQADELACKVYGVNSSLTGLDMGGHLDINKLSQSGSQSIIELKPVVDLPPTPSSLSPPDVSSVNLLQSGGSHQGATISWNLPDLLVGLESSMRSSAQESPPHSSNLTFTSTIPISCTNNNPLTHSETVRQSQYSYDSYRQPDSLLEGLGILTPPPVGMARVKTELSSSTESSPLGSITNLSIPQYNIDTGHLSELAPLTPNFELNLSPKSEPGGLNSSSSFSVSIANIDILTGRTTEPGTTVPLSLDLIAQHCTLLPPELVGHGEQILVPSLSGSLGTRLTNLASFISTDQMADQTMAELSPIIQEPMIKEEGDDVLDTRIMEVDQPTANQGCYKRCHLCVRIFSTKANLSSHIRHVHLGEAKHSRVKSIPCPHCNKMFSRKGHMTEHVRTVHEGKKRIYKEVNCQHCGKTFRRKWGLNIHISSAHADVVSSLVK